MILDDNIARASTDVDKPWVEEGIESDPGDFYGDDGDDDDFDDDFDDD
jgi:hypothetical protein